MPFVGRSGTRANPSPAATPGLNLYGHVFASLGAGLAQTMGARETYPFYFVQLPGQENISNNPRIREEQQKVLALKNTGLAVTIDNRRFGSP